MMSITRNERTVFALTVSGSLSPPQIDALRRDWDRAIGGPLIVLGPGEKLEAFNAEVRHDVPAPAGWDTLENVR